ncbi:class I SAM-dependent methyltransferase [Halomarina oriensis]|uniref:Methyltransferase domain-containing protein n=1 Tax=Halomarina oriensis TaxID=671145 RepID=A0A6B0GUP3_9EURY|nr:class I SAM-dependent methyltransferase [Halomarina oriensis]MWG36303.1 methyltransferase domain-containing protein [Halomarina oriensis]
MERRHGKPVDPRQFKQDDLADLAGAVETNRRRAESFDEDERVTVERCPVCDAGERSVVRRAFGYEYAQCGDCTHVYLTTRPTERALFDHLATSETLSSVYTDDRQRAYRREHITEPKFDFALEHVDADTGRWLDVGCGMGESVDYLRSKGWAAEGIEPSEECVRAAREAFDVDLIDRSLDEFAATTPEGSYDVVSLFGILVMNPDPLAQLRQVRRLLGEDGYVVLGDAHYDSVSSMVQRTIPDRAHRHSIPPVGMHQFTGDSIGRMFEVVGFEPVAVWYFGLDFYDFLTHLQLELDGFADSDLSDYFMDNLDDFQRTIDEDERSDYVVVVGRRV